MPADTVGSAGQSGGFCMGITDVERRRDYLLGAEENAEAPMIVRAMDKGAFVRVNDSFKVKTGFDATELAEKPFLDWIDPCDRTIVQTALENNERNFFARHITRDGSSLQLRIQVTEHEEGLFILGRCTNIPTQLESYGMRPAVDTVSGTLDAIARIIEEQHIGYKCSILLVDEGNFVFGAGPSLPDEYNAAINGCTVGPNVGSCGTAIFWNTPVIVEDIQADPLWAPFAELAKQAGVAACWSYPFISSGGNVLGALALYSPEPCAPTTEQLRQLKAAARITGLAVERGRAEEELKRTKEAIKTSEGRFRALFHEHAAIFLLVDPATGSIIDANKSAAAFYGYSIDELRDMNIGDINILPPDKVRGVLDAVVAKTNNHFKFRHRLKSGEIRNIDAYVTLITQNGCKLI
jgi:PAS domain S-box-containing protein